MTKIAILSVLISLFMFLLNGCDSEKKRNQNSEKTSLISENVTFYNAKDRVTLSGTLALPKQKGTFPAVVLISGNGEHNRDAELGHHKPFKDISDYLTSTGLAVLRYDKRGVGESTGQFETATTYDFAEDVKAALHYLLTRKEIQKDKIGLIGHSEGGLIAPIVASNSPNVSFIVLLAGPGLPGDSILLSQQKAIAMAKGMSKEQIESSQNANRDAFDIVQKYTNPDTLYLKMAEYIKRISRNDPDKPENMTLDEYVEAQMNSILRPWMVNFLRYDPRESLKRVDCPVLALNGTKDLQVLAKENLPAIKKAVESGGNKKVTVKELPKLNHSFQESKTGLPSEYEEIDESFSPMAMKEMRDWIQKQIK